MPEDAELCILEGEEGTSVGSLRHSATLARRGLFDRAQLCLSKLQCSSKDTLSVVDKLRDQQRSLLENEHTALELNSKLPVSHGTKLIDMCNLADSVLRSNCGNAVQRLFSRLAPNMGEADVICEQLDKRQADNKANEKRCIDVVRGLHKKLFDRMQTCIKEENATREKIEVSFNCLSSESMALGVFLKKLWYTKLLGD